MYNVNDNTTVQDIANILSDIDTEDSLYAIKFQSSKIGAIYKDGELLSEFYTYQDLNNILNKQVSNKNIDNIRSKIEDLIKDPKVLEEVATIIMEKLNI
jgi:hypothetical protein